MTNLPTITPPSVADTVRQLSWVFVAGVVSSIGVCAAPRVLAACAVARGRADALMGFAVGILIGYLIVGLGLDVVQHVFSLTQFTYTTVAMCLIGYGSWSLFQSRHHCGTLSQPYENVSVTTAFFVGSSFAFILSPCCAPMIFFICAFPYHSWLRTEALIGMYALGHIAPVVCCSLGEQHIRKLPNVQKYQKAFDVGSAVLTILLGCYYAVLA